MGLARRQFLSGFGTAASLAFCGRARQARADFDIPDSPPEVSMPRTRQEARHPRLASRSNDPVASAIVMGIDCSFSIDQDEFVAQVQATADACMPGEDTDSPVESAIRMKGGTKAIAMCVVLYSLSAKPELLWVDFRANDPHLRQRMAGFAEELRSMPQWQRRDTHIATMLDTGEKMIDLCPWPITERKVIDVCGDGTCDLGATSLRHRRDRLAERGITVNALAIEGKEVKTLGIDLQRYFEENLVTQETGAGPDRIFSEPGFSWVAAALEETGVVERTRVIELALKRKVILELAGVEDGKRLLSNAFSAADLGILQRHSPVRSFRADAPRLA